MATFSLTSVPPQTPERNKHEVWAQVRRSPACADMELLLFKALDAARARYETQQASEFNRGQVIALIDIINFMQTGNGL